MQHKFNVRGVKTLKVLKGPGSASDSLEDDPENDPELSYLNKKRKILKREKTKQTADNKGHNEKENGADSDGEKDDNPYLTRNSEQKALNVLSKMAKILRAPS